MKPRTLVIGDIHGRYAELLRVLDMVDYKDSDRIIFLGDYIDRGDHSKKVLEFLIDLSKNKDNVFLRGNHEFMIIQTVEGDSYLSTWLEDGDGARCMRSYGIDPDRLRRRGGLYLYPKGRERKSSDYYMLNNTDDLIDFMKGMFPKEHLEFMRKTRECFESGDYFFCHAGLQAFKNINNQNPSIFIWGDDLSFVNDNKTDYGKIVIFGHYHVKRPFVGFKKVGIAIKQKVGVLDLDSMLVTVSDGSCYEIDRH
jgi:serine/threonine protein phosphatase 1